MSDERKKDVNKLKAMLRDGETLQNAMLASGWPESQAKRGKAGLGKQTLRAIAKSKIDLGRSFTAGDQEALVRGALIENALDGKDAAVQSLKLLGQDRRVNMFTAESQTGIIVIQSPVPTATDSLQLEDKPTTLLGE